jgi:hypothetical protein
MSTAHYHIVYSFPLTIEKVPEFDKYISRIKETGELATFSTAKLLDFADRREIILDHDMNIVADYLHYDGHTFYYNGNTKAAKYVGCIDDMDDVVDKDDLQNINLLNVTSSSIYECFGIMTRSLKELVYEVMTKFENVAGRTSNIEVRCYNPLASGLDVLDTDNLACKAEKARVRYLTFSGGFEVLKSEWFSLDAAEPINASYEYTRDYIDTL